MIFMLTNQQFYLPQMSLILILTFFSPRSRMLSMSSSVISLSLEANTWLAPCRIMFSTSSLPSLLLVLSTRRPETNDIQKELKSPCFLTFNLITKIIYAFRVLWLVSISDDGSKTTIMLSDASKLALMFYLFIEKKCSYVGYLKGYCISFDLTSDTINYINPVIFLLNYLFLK